MLTILCWGGIGDTLRNIGLVPHDQEVEEVAHTMAALWLTGICCEPEQTISPVRMARESAPESANRSLAAPKRV